MGLKDTLISSIVKVVSGLAGFVLFFAGGQTAVTSGTIGTIMLLAGVVLMVFAAKV